MIGIVGAGLTGLALVHRLAERGVACVAFEAAHRPGGVIRSARVDGRVLEWGPQRTRLTGEVEALVAELGLGEEALLAPPDLPLYVWAAGALREVPFSLGGLLRSDLLRPAARARLLLEPLTRAPRPDESVADLFRRKLGRQAYERLAGPLYGGLTASDPADMVVGHALARTLEELGVGRSLLVALLSRGGAVAPPPAASFRDGMQALTDALHRRHRERVRLGAAVRRLRPGDGGWVLGLDGGDVAVDRVVLACPADETARLLADAAPAAAGRVARLRSNPLAVVHLRSGARLRGLGHQVALGEGLATRGVTWNAALFPGREGVYTAFLGGATRPAIVGEPDAALGARAAREFHLVTGQDAEPLAVDRTRVPAWDATWAALDGLRLPDGVRAAGAWRSRPGIPGRLAEARRLADELARATGPPAGTFPI